MKYKNLLIILVASLFLHSCSKENSSHINGEIIKFNSDKCGCCWGWTIKTDREIIKADHLPYPEKIGYEIESPIPVIIELGNCERECPIDGYDYYEIISLQLVR